MYSNKILNFHESLTILNSWTKKSGNLLNARHILNICFVNLFCWYTRLNDQTVLFQTVQFSIRQQNQIILSIAVLLTIQLNISLLFVLSLKVKQLYLTLSGVTTLGQKENGRDGNEGILHIPQRGWRQTQYASSA